MPVSKLAWATCVSALVMGAQAFVIVVDKHNARSTFAAQLQSHRDLVDAKANSNLSVDSAPRREAFQTLAAAVSAGLFSTFVAPTQPALASGGATAGKYTTIPIAKRRYYGRVQQAVHDFLAMAPEMKKADTTGEKIQFFFDTSGVVVVEARRQDISGQCTKKDSKCQGKEIRDSRWNDMKTSMYLLGNAFRQNQQKPPDKLPTVQAAKAFFVKMDALEKRVTTKAKVGDAKALELYADALDILDVYLDLVELPPTGSGHYDKEFDTLVGEAARIT